LKSKIKNIFDKKNCVLTGATGGIGKELAVQLAENNCNLFLIGQNEKKLKILKQKLTKINENIEIFIESVDLTDVNSINKVTKKIHSEFSPVLILINCAGRFVINPINQTTLEELDKSFSINFKAPFILSKEFSKDMVKRKWGRIVNIGSSSSYLGFDGGTIYSSSKHAVLGFFKKPSSRIKKA